MNNNNENLKESSKIAPVGNSWNLLYELNSNACYKEFSEWDEIINFEEYELPEFDTTIFPEVLQKYINAICIFTQTPSDLSAICLFGALSTALQKKFVVEPNPGWKEPLNTYTTVLMGPSNRKSAVFEAIFNPIKKFEQALQNDYAKEKNTNELKMRLLEKRIEKLEKDYVNKGNDNILNDLEKLHAEKNNLKIGSEPALILDNSTEESLISKLFRNQEKITIASSEGDLFERIKASVRLDSHKNDVYLKGYSGDSLKVDRVTRDGEKLNNPLLTICIAAQQTVIDEMPQKIIDRGFIPRFLISVPKDLLGQRDVFEALPIPKTISDDYNAFLNTLLKFDCKETPSIQLSTESYNFLKQFEFEIEKLFLSDRIYAEQLRGWGGKILGNLLRIAGLLHVTKHTTIDCSKSDIPLVLELDTLCDALNLKSYFDAHIQKAFGIMQNNVFYEQAKYLLEKITQESNKEHTYTVEKQKIWQLTKKKFVTAKELHKSLDFLIERNYIRIGIGANSRSKEYIVLNPQYVEEIWKAKDLQKNGGKNSNG